MKLDGQLRRVAQAVYEQLNTPVSLSCYMLMKYGEWGQLAAKAVTPINYVEGPWGAISYFRDSQACNFLRKSPLLPVKVDRVAAAKEQFHECEAQCKTTNEFLRVLKFRSESWSNNSLQPIENRLVSILDRARKICSRVLGPVPDRLVGRFGPGTSAELKGSVFTTMLDKLWVTPHATPRAMPIFRHDYVSTHWERTRVAMGLPYCGTIRGNRFTTVKKDALKDRGICIEPLGNLWCQLGVGGVMKHRLKNVGLHVGTSKPDVCRFTTLKTVRRDGQSYHREMAREGSLTGRWATIDLSNASDTVCFELVRWVIPPDWFEVLSDLRSPYTLLDRTWHRLEKFSSMGNGFTFELESLIFAALAAAVSDLKLGVDAFSYGDDVIVPEVCAKDVVALLKAVGFTPNVKKSFTEGPFKESCGGDYFSGYDVRSCYADSELKTPLDWMVLHNQLKLRSLNRASRRCVDAVPKRFRKFGPARLGDQVFHGHYKPRRLKRGYDVVAVVVPTLNSYSINRWSTGMEVTLSLLGGIRNGKSADPPRITPRGKPADFRIRFASVS